LQAEAERLCTFGELATDRVVVGRFGVVEDQRGLGQLRDGGAPRGTRRVGADVEDLIAHDRAHVEPFLVDRQEHDRGFELAAAHPVGDRR
jgi:hypothetical protein